MNTDPDDARAAELRQQLLADLTGQGAVSSDDVAAAVLAVRRHLFLPGEDLEAAYADQSVITKTDEAGKPISSASQPSIVTRMLEQAQVKPGERILEIGAGTGWNAGLLAHLAGPGGQVTTIDIDADFTTAARQRLDTAGYERVNVICRDGQYGAPEHAPYDLVIVTVGATDPAPAWLDQLAPGGRIVVPLRLRGLSRSVVLEPASGTAGEYWRSTDLLVCGFVGIQGDGEFPLVSVELGAGSRLSVDDGQHADAHALAAAFAMTPRQIWTGVVLNNGEGVLPDLDLWLATSLDSYGRIRTSQDAVDGGSAGWTLPLGSSATWNDTSVAYMSIRSGAQPGTNELGVWVHGDDTGLGEQMAEQIRHWSRTHRGGGGPVIAIYPDTVPAEDLPSGRLIPRPHHQVLFTWP